MMLPSVPPGVARRLQAMGIAHVIKPILPSALRRALRDDSPGSRPAGQVPMPGWTGGGEPLRILLADDNPVNQLVATRLLARKGHHVTVTHNGLEAVEQFRVQPFDLVLMDVHMPVMDGLEATRQIRELELRRGTCTPIIALTASDMAGDRQSCLASGMDDYVAKPVVPRLLFAAIEQAVGRAS